MEDISTESDTSGHADCEDAQPPALQKEVSPIQRKLTPPSKRPTLKPAKGAKRARQLGLSLNFDQLRRRPRMAEAAGKEKGRTGSDAANHGREEAAAKTQRSDGQPPPPQHAPLQQVQPHVHFQQPQPSTSAMPHHYVQGISEVMFHSQKWLSHPYFWTDFDLLGFLWKLKVSSTSFVKVLFMKKLIMAVL